MTRDRRSPDGTRAESRARPTKRWRQGEGSNEPMQGTISEPQPSLDTEGHSMGGRDEALVPPVTDTPVWPSGRPDRSKEREA